MTRVLHLRSSFEPGGTETLLLNLFNHRQGLFTMYLALLKDGTLIRELDPASENVFYRLFRKGFLDLNVLVKLHDLVKKENIEIIHTHQFIELVYAVLLKVRNPHLRLVHQIHLLFSRRDLSFYLERWLGQRFARIITVSESAKTALIEEFGYRKAEIGVLYNAVEMPDATENADAFAADGVFPHFDPDRKNLVMVANFVWGKDHETILKAYDRFMRKQMPEVSIYFIGRQSEISEKLKQKYLKPGDLAQGRVVFTGPIPNAKRYLHRFDVVLQSSFSETFNLALVEAAALGRPILASDIDVFRELSEEGRRFQLFRTGDAKDFFQKLGDMLANPALEEARANAGYFSRKFGYPDFIQSLAGIYQDRSPVPALKEAATP